MKEEMSKLNSILPRHYKGHDIDILIDKIRKDEPLSETEADIYDEVHTIYYKKEYERRERKAQESREQAKKDNKILFGTRIEYHSPLGEK